MTGIKGLFRNTLVRNVWHLFSSNVLALLLPFFLAPVLTRLYIPSQFATFELFAKLLGFIAVLSTLRYELAIVLPKKESHAALLGWKAIVFCFRTSLVCFLILLFWKKEIAFYLNNPELAEVLLWIPLAVMATGLFGVFNQFLVRSEQFKALGRLKILNIASNQAVKIGVGYWYAHPLTLILGHILGLLITPLVLWRKFRSFLKNRNAAVDGNPLKEYSDFPRVNLPHALTDELEKLLLLMLISIYFGEVWLGLFAFTLRYLRIPVQIFGTSLGQVLVPRFSKKFQDGLPVQGEVLKTIGLLMAVGIVPFSILFFWGEPLFNFILGNNWGKAGKLAEIMSVWLFLNFLVSPLSFLPSIYRRQSIFFYVSIISSIVYLLGIWWAGNSGFSFYSLVELITLIQGLSMVVKLFIIYSITSKAPQRHA